MWQAWLCKAALEVVKLLDGVGTASRRLDPQNGQDGCTEHMGRQCSVAVQFRNEQMWWLHPADHQKVDGSRGLL